jgi:tetratricopeptide (TPR) repeat protein
LENFEKMRLRNLTLVLGFSSLLIFGCTKEKPALMMPVTTSSELALKYYEAGMVAYDQIKYSLGWHSMEIAVEQDPDFFMAYFWMYLMSSSDSNTVFEKAMKTGASLTPAEEEVKVSLKYLVDGQNEKVEEHLGKVIDMYPSDPWTHKMLYQIEYFYFKDVDAAIASLNRAIKECPDYPWAYNLLGYAYMEQEDYVNAEKAFDNYIRVAPEQANPYDSKGDYFMAIKEFEKAYDSYMKAYEIDPEYFDVSKKKAEKAKMMLEKEAKEIS